MTQPAQPDEPVEPYTSGRLDVGDGNTVYWEICGNPDGKPAVMVHGGPGSGCTPKSRRAVDLDRYRLVLFDQRGCGRSTPHASDPRTAMRFNTTEHLVSDLERLREHLGIDSWLLIGGSWGSTLLLAYAERFPARVSQIVIAAVTMSRPSELDWLYRGVGRFFPEAWQRFRAGVPEAERDGNLLAAYARLLDDPDDAVREQAATDWCAWEDTVVSLESGAAKNLYGSRPSVDMLALVRICAHYFANNAWLPDGVLLRDAHKLAGIPGLLVHGRQDLSAPVTTAWELARAWPDAELYIDDNSGHRGSPSKRAKITEALARFADA